jgi:hypothetical protein
MDAIAATPWWIYLAAFFASAFLVNGAPHFIHGVSGKPFPTPFSGGAGTLDGPVRNVFWGGANLVAGGTLLWLVWPRLGNPVVVVELVVAAILFGALLGYAFAHPEKIRPKRGGGSR